MKRTLQVVLLSTLLLGVAIPAAAHQLDRTRAFHILRPFAMAGHAIGMTAEYVVMRPLHWMVSRSQVDVFVGHVAYVADDPTYFEWSHGDYRPSIAVERSSMKKTYHLVQAMFASTKTLYQQLLIQYSPQTHHRRTPIKQVHE